MAKVKDENPPVDPEVTKQVLIPAGFVQIDFDEDVFLGGENTNKIQIREPRSGDLRGLKVMDLLNLDVLSIITLVPRLNPRIKKAELEDLALSSMLTLQKQVVDFFG